MIPDSADQAITFGQAQRKSGSDAWYGLCLKFVRTAFGAPAMGGDAHSAWHAAHTRHPADGTHPPRGVPVFFRGGAHGHVVISLGQGRCLTTDFVRRGKVDRADIAAIAKGWGLEVLGWTEDINGVAVTGWTQPAKDPHEPFRRRLKLGMRGSDVEDLKWHLGLRGPGRRTFGPGTRRHVIAVQRKADGRLGTADGIVGPMTYKAITGHK